MLSSIRNMFSKPDPTNSLLHYEAAAYGDLKKVYEVLNNHPDEVNTGWDGEFSKVENTDTWFDTSQTLLKIPEHGAALGATALAGFLGAPAIIASGGAYLGTVGLVETGKYLYRSHYSNKRRGWTMLEFAAETGQIKIAKAILKHLAYAGDPLNLNEDRFLEIAKNNGHTVFASTCSQLLKEYRAEEYIVTDDTEILPKIIEESEEESSLDSEVESNKNDGEKEPLIEIKEPVITKPEPVVEMKEPITVKPEPAVEMKEPVTEKPEPIVEIKKPVTAESEFIVKMKEPVTAKPKPVISQKKALVTKKKPAIKTNISSTTTEIISQLSSPTELKMETVAVVAEPKKIESSVSINLDDSLDTSLTLSCFEVDQQSLNTSLTHSQATLFASSKATSSQLLHDTDLDDSSKHFVLEIEKEIRNTDFYMKSKGVKIDLGNGVTKSVPPTVAIHWSYIQKAKVNQMLYSFAVEKIKEASLKALSTYSPNRAQATAAYYCKTSKADFKICKQQL